MNLVLIGYRGTGKSRVGKVLAQQLQMTCVAMDEVVVQQNQMSIPEIVERFGWSKFRDLETDVARALAQRDQLVVDAGGGVVERPENIELLRKSGCLIWFKASVETIVRRIESCTERPALTSGKSFTEEVAEVLERRRPLYEAAADFEVDTDDLTPEQVAERVAQFWRQFSEKSRA